MEVEEYTFKELLSRIVDNRGRTCPTAETGTALIATNCIKDDQLYPVFEKIRWVDQETMETWFRGHPEPGDILFVLKGSPGRCCLVPDPINFCIAQDMLALRADESKVSQKFLFALLRSSTVRAAIDSLHVGTMIPHFKKGDFDQLTFQIPKSRKIQDWIGEQYFTLSDKIELNRRMNATLEGMAQALFKSWFVDFDPVIDNALAAGNPIPDELAYRAEVRRQALANGTINREAAKPFPDSFQKTREMGWIPDGWAINYFESQFAIPSRNGLTKPKRIRGEGTHMVNMGELFGHDRLGNVPMERVPMSPLELERYMLEENDLLFARQSLTFEGAGKLSIVRSAEEPRTFESHLIRCRIDPTRSPANYWFHSFRSHIGRSAMSGIVEQVAAAGIRASDLSRLRFLIPSADELRHFDDVIKQFELRISANLDENNTFTELSDTLLPKLISGELRIPEAEQLTKEALA